MTTLSRWGVSTSLLGDIQRFMDASVSPPLKPIPLSTVYIRDRFMGELNRIKFD